MCHPAIGVVLSTACGTIWWMTVT